MGQQNRDPITDPQQVFTSQANKAQGAQEAGKMADYSKEIIGAIQKGSWAQPGMGLKDLMYDPREGLRRERQRKETQGLTAKERMKVLTAAGVRDHDGMAKVFDRLYTSPERAFMLVRRK